MSNVINSLVWWTFEIQTHPNNYPSLFYYCKSCQFMLALKSIISKKMQLNKKLKWSKDMFKKLNMGHTSYIYSSEFYHNDESKWGQWP